MGRPRRIRNISKLPKTNYFKPQGIRLSKLEEVNITIDELEAVRLNSLEKLPQTEAAKKMNISQPTLHRLMISFEKKVADAFINGKAIKIEGGECMFQGKRLGRRFRRGKI